MEERNAAIQLLDLYNRKRRQTFTKEDIETYMLGMCSRRAQERGTGDYDRLGNMMLVMQFGGPTNGQVRHIDNMVPNLQVCLYMSKQCPSTVVYEMEDDGSPVIDGASLVEYWQRLNGSVPDLVRRILLDDGDRKLGSKWYAQHFAQWVTINSQLLCFGKLYQPIARALGLTVEPGTTLLAGGNEIHGGPPTAESRMFAFAIGIPEDRRECAADGDNYSQVEYDVGDEQKDGEVQYSPVLLHIEFCCLLFSMLDFEYGIDGDEDSARCEAKIFLVGVLIDLIRDYPLRQYLIQVDEEQVGIRIWLEKVLRQLEDGPLTNALVVEAVEILYSPDVIKRRCRKKKKNTTESSVRVNCP